MGASGALMLKRLIDRSAGQATQSLAIASTSDGRIVIVSVSQVVIRVVQRNAILPRVENVSASLAAVVATARAAHDVAELDAAALAVPHEEADDDEDEAAESEGQSDGERMACGKFGLRVLRQSGLLEKHWEGDGAVLVVAAVGSAQKGDGDVVGLLAHEIILFDFKRPEPPRGGHLVVVEALKLNPLIACPVEVVQANGDIISRVGLEVGLVIVVGIPGN